MIFRERNLTTLNDNYKTKKKKKTKGDIFEKLKGATDFPNIFQTFQIFLLWYFGTECAGFRILNWP